MKKISVGFMVAMMFFIGGLGMLGFALQLPYKSAVTTIGGPGTFPTMVLVILVFFSGVLVLTEYKKLRSGTYITFKYEPGDFKRILSVIVASFIYLVVIEATGYLIATFVFTAVLLWLFGFREKMPFIVITVIYPILIFFTFKTLLNIPLP